MKEFKKQFFYSFFLSLSFVLLLWVIFTISLLFNLDIGGLGIFPRSSPGLFGIITGPLVHAGMEHLASNSFPLIVLGTIIIFFNREIFLRIFIQIYLLSGIGVWAFGRSVFHIGASGIIYGLASFLVVKGILKRDRTTMGIALLVIFLYGGLIWGVIPTTEQVSWESHLFGLVSGAIVAVLNKNKLKQEPVFKDHLAENEPHDMWDYEKKMPPSVHFRKHPEEKES